MHESHTTFAPDHTKRVSWNSLAIKSDLSYLYFDLVIDRMTVARHCMSSCTTSDSRRDRGQSVLNFEHVSETTVCDYFFTALERATRANIQFPVWHCCREGLRKMCMPRKLPLGALRTSNISPERSMRRQFSNHCTAKVAGTVTQKSFFFLYMKFGGLTATWPFFALWKVAQTVQACVTAA